MLSLPSVFIFLVLSLASLRTVAFCSIVIAVGFFLPALIDRAKRNHWCDFVVDTTSSSVGGHATMCTHTAEIIDEGCSPNGSEHDGDEEEEERRRQDTLLPR